MDQRQKHRYNQKPKPHRGRGGGNRGTGQSMSGWRGGYRSPRPSIRPGLLGEGPPGSFVPQMHGYDGPPPGKYSQHFNPPRYWSGPSRPNHHMGPPWGDDGFFQPVHKPSNATQVYNYDNTGHHSSEDRFTDDYNSGYQDGELYHSFDQTDVAPHSKAKHKVMQSHSGRSAPLKTDSSKGETERKDKVQLSQKASLIIDTILRGEKPKKKSSASVKVTESDTRESQANCPPHEQDRGASLLETAENLCRAIWNKRAFLSSKLKVAQKEVIGSSKFSKHLPELPTRRDSSLSEISTSGLHSSVKYPSRLSVGSNSSASSSRSNQSVEAIHGRQAASSNTLAAKDNLLRMVNSPRTYRERMKVQSILQSHQKSQLGKVAGRPKLHLHNSAEDISDSEHTDGDNYLEFEMLPDELKDQIAQLIGEENAEDDFHIVSDTQSGGDDSDIEVIGGTDIIHSSVQPKGKVSRKASSKTVSERPSSASIDLDSPKKKREKDSYDAEGISKDLQDMLVNMIKESCEMESDLFTEDGVSSLMQTFSGEQLAKGAVSSNKDGKLTNADISRLAIKTENQSSHSLRANEETQKTRKSDLPIDGSPSRKGNDDVSVGQISKTSSEASKKTKIDQQPQISQPASNMYDALVAKMKAKEQTQVVQSLTTMNTHTTCSQDEHTSSSLMPSLCSSTADDIITGQDSSGSGKRRRIKAKHARKESCSPTMSTAKRAKIDEQPIIDNNLCDSSANAESDQMVGSLSNCNQNVNDSAVEISQSDTMDQMLKLSLREEELRHQIGELTGGIGELQELLDLTQTKLNQKVEEKQQLVAEEENLRTQRIKLLKGAVGSRSSSICSTSSQSPQISRPSDRPSSESSAGQDPATIIIRPQVCTSSQDRETVDELSHTAGTSATFDEAMSVKQERHHGYTDEEDGPVEPDTTVDTESPNSSEVLPESVKHEELLVPSSGSLGSSNSSVTTATGSRKEGDESCQSVHYIGTLDPSGLHPDLLQKLAADLQHTPYVFMEESELTGSTGSTSENTERPENETAETTPRGRTMRRKKCKKSKIMADNELFKKPKDGMSPPRSVTPVVRKSSRQRSVSPSGQVQNSKGKKSQKKKLNWKGKTGSNRSETEDVSPHRGGKSKQKSKKAMKLKKNQKNPEAVKVVQEYLHGSSSSDCEIEGLKHPMSVLPSTCTSANSTVQEQKVMGRQDESSNQEGLSTDCSSLKLQLEDLTVFTSSADSGGEWITGKPSKYPAGGFETGISLKVHSLAIWAKFLIVGFADGQIWKYSRKTLKTGGLYIGHTAAVDCLLPVEIPGGLRLYSGCSEGQLLEHELKSGKTGRPYRYATGVTCLCQHASLLYVGLANGSVMVFDYKIFRNVDAFKCSAKKITSVLTTREGPRRLLCVSSEDCSISVRDAKTGLLIRSLEGHTKPPIMIKVSGPLLLSGGTDHMIQGHNINTGEMERLLRFRSAVTAFDVTGPSLLVAEQKGLLHCISSQDFVREKCYFTQSKKPLSAMMTDKDMVYVGDIKGNLEAIRLDYNANWACKFGPCELRFGSQVHLQHHLVVDHISPTCQPLSSPSRHGGFLFKCHWEGCSDFIGLQDSTKAAEEHMRKKHLDCMTPQSTTPVDVPASYSHAQSFSYLPF